MKTTRKSNSFGPVMTCGAAAISFNHEPGEPTDIDLLFNAIKRFAKSGVPSMASSFEVPASADLARSTSPVDSAIAVARA